MGIKERRTKILLALYILTSSEFTPLVFDEKVQSILDLTMNQKTRGTLSGMIKEGTIEKDIQINQKTEDGRQKTEDGIQYRLTEKGFQTLCLEFPFFRFLKDKWDGKWRVLSYEIPEKKRELRDRLRREVAGWGLGPWHRSFWLTPHPIIDNLKDLVSQKEEEMYIQAFESDHVFGNRDTLIEKVWGKTNLDKQYRSLFKKWHEILSSEVDKVQKLTKVVNEYVTLLRLDPGLPVELVGQSWIGFEAFNIFKEIKSILLG